MVSLVARIAEWRRRRALSRLTLFRYDPCRGECFGVMLAGTFVVLGSPNNCRRRKYVVGLFRPFVDDAGWWSLTCTCKRFHSGKFVRACKHICFLVRSVGGISSDFESTLSASQADRLLQRTRALLRNSMNAQFQQHRRCRPRDGDVCPICLDNVDDPALVCPDCGNQVHARCMEEWLATQNRGRTCIFCRSDAWEQYSTFEAAV